MPSLLDPQSDDQTQMPGGLLGIPPPEDGVTSALGNSTAG
jgi:hypothetical protein